MDKQCGQMDAPIGYHAIFSISEVSRNLSNRKIGWTNGISLLEMPLVHSLLWHLPFHLVLVRVINARMNSNQLHNMDIHPLR